MLGQSAFVAQAGQRPMRAMALPSGLCLAHACAYVRLSRVGRAHARARACRGRVHGSRAQTMCVCSPGWAATESVGKLPFAPGLVHMPSSAGTGGVNVIVVVSPIVYIETVGFTKRSKRLRFDHPRSAKALEKVVFRHDR